jgi:hypothetical protein
MYPHLQDSLFKRAFGCEPERGWNGIIHDLYAFGCEREGWDGSPMENIPQKGGMD